MQRVRRDNSEVRLDMMPMIDVVFLLLTFFVFAMVLMVRLDVSEIRLPSARAGEAQLERTPAITVTLAQSGELTINGEAVERSELVPALRGMLEETPESSVFIAADETSETGDLFKLMDSLEEAGISDLRFLRRPSGE